VHAAPWLMLTATVTDDGQPRLVDGNPLTIGAILRTSEAEVADTWHSLGMRSTDSNDIAIDDVFVPRRRTFVFNPEFQAGRHYRSPIYRAPALAAALAPWTGVALAIARAAIDETRRIAQQKTPFVSTTTLRERASAQANIGRAEAHHAAARALLYATLGDAWRRTLDGVPATLEEKIALLMASVHTVQSAARAVELAFCTAGTTAIYTKNPLERHFRDIQVLRQHGFLCENRYETVGQVLCGLPPDLGLAVF
jgi:indole-3-acetate monooxygenase